MKTTIDTSAQRAGEAAACAGARVIALPGAAAAPVVQVRRAGRYPRCVTKLDANKRQKLEAERAAQIKRNRVRVADDIRRLGPQLTFYGRGWYERPIEDRSTDFELDWLAVWIRTLQNLADWLRNPEGRPYPGVAPEPSDI